MSETLLLVDDEEGIRNVLKISLMDSGYTVYTAAGVDEALAVFAEHRPSIILTDIKMPGQTGIDLLRQVKELDSEVEVIMLTGHGDLDLAIQSLKLNATDFLTKPVNDEVLEFSLRRARERIRMRRELREYAENLEEKVREKSAKLVEAERQLAALQVINGISSGINSLTRVLESEPLAASERDGTAAAGVFNALPCFVAVHNNDLTIVSINELFRERLGDLKGKSSWAAYAAESVPDKHACPAFLVLEDGVGHRTYQEMVDKSGRKIPVITHTVPIYDNDGEIELILELSVDTTEVNRLREELRLTRERYRQLFDESPSYVAVIDKNMRLIEANRRYRDDFGEPGGHCCHELYLHRETVCKDCPALRTFEDGHTHQHETVVTAKDGRQINVLIVTAALHDAEGNIAEVMEMSADITELRSLQDHLAQLGLLLGSTAHGIKGLLTALDGSVYRMGSGLKFDKPERVEDGFKDMRLLVGKLRKLVLDILYYSKNREIAWEESPVLAFAKETAALVQSKAEEQNIQLICEFEADAQDTFEADPGAVSSALVNILENAMEACASNPTPPSSGNMVIFRVQAGADNVTFSVTDNGPGMDRETREKLFTLFFSSKGSSGTGIGLFVANQMVKQHCGTINVDSEPGHGATFTLTLHRRLPDSVKAAPSGDK